MSVLDILRTDSESRTEIDQLRNPSETIWPATVAIIVELCPENKSAIANSTPAAKRNAINLQKSPTQNTSLTFTNILGQ